MSESEAPATIAPLLAIMQRLRDPDSGCPWDIAQDFASIAPYTIEEAYEVADAIARSDLDALKDELGDLLLQVVFHAQMASEQGAFDFGEVVGSICGKMVRRHPHIFAGERYRSIEEQNAAWEASKAAERGGGTLAGVALALPALMRAHKIQKRASRVGFDWPDASGPRRKVAEELREFEDAASEAAKTEEMGDLLFTVVNLARHHGIDPETALRNATAKFETRFQAVEAMADKPLSDHDESELDILWERAKAALKSR